MARAVTCERHGVVERTFAAPRQIDGAHDFFCLLICCSPVTDRESNLKASFRPTNLGDIAPTGAG